MNEKERGAIRPSSDKPWAGPFLHFLSSLLHARPGPALVFLFPFSPARAQAGHLPPAVGLRCKHLQRRTETGQQQREQGDRWQVSGVIRGSEGQSGRQAGNRRGHARLLAGYKTGEGKSTEEGGLDWFFGGERTKSSREGESGESSLQKIETTERVPRKHWEKNRIVTRKKETGERAREGRGRAKGREQDWRTASPSPVVCPRVVVHRGAPLWTR